MALRLKIGTAQAKLKALLPAAPALHSIPASTTKPSHFRDELLMKN
jgi:hypothetical protein